MKPYRMISFNLVFSLKTLYTTFLIGFFIHGTDNLEKQNIVAFKHI